MQSSELHILLTRLMDLHRQATREDDEPWRIVQEPHDHKDGTTHFTHVQYTAHDVNGAPMTVEIGRYLTPDLANLLVLTHNNLPEIIELARRGIDRS